MDTSLYYTTHASALGPLLMVASARGLRYLTLLDDAAQATPIVAQKFPNAAPYALDGFFASTADAIDAYLADGTTLSLPVDLTQGTPLQRAVWFAIAKIPHGETITYGQLAERVGFPRAVRAVAAACGANPVPLAIPCHRVIGKDRSLTGFSMGGVEVKERLLNLETSQTAAAEAA